MITSGPSLRFSLGPRVSRNQKSMTSLKILWSTRFVRGIHPTPDTVNHAPSTESALLKAVASFSKGSLSKSWADQDVTATPNCVSVSRYVFCPSLLDLWFVMTYAAPWRRWDQRHQPKICASFGWTGEVCHEKPWRESHGGQKPDHASDLGWGLITCETKNKIVAVALQLFKDV